MNDDIRDRLVRRFTRFAESEAPAVGSPLYARLAAGVAEHDDLLSILADTHERQQRPTTFFAAVQDVLLRHADHPLAQHYARITGGAPAPDRDPVGDLVDFVSQHRDAIVTLASTRGTQTNETLRAVGLAPALATVAHDVGRPLSLLELGPSAGLLLRLDRYAYTYRGADGVDTETAGADGARDLELVTDVRFGDTPPAHLMPAPIVDRLGLDLAPLDVTDEDDVRWLRACVWPEHVERAARLDVGLNAAAQDPPPLVQGDMLDDLGDAIGRLDPAGHVTLMHCVALMYLPRDRRDRLRTTLAELSRVRPLDVISFEDGRIEPFDALTDRDPEDEIRGVIGRSAYRDGEVTHTVLGYQHMHGRWIDWRA